MRASRAPLIVLTGGPGCGKTFATKAIVQLWQSQQKDVRLAAPTGPSRPPRCRPQVASPFNMPSSPVAFPLHCVSGWVPPQVPASHKYRHCCKPWRVLCWSCGPLFGAPWLLSMPKDDTCEHATPARRPGSRAAAGGGQRQEHQGHHHPPPPQLQVLVPAPPRHRQGLRRGQAATLWTAITISAAK